MSEPPRVTPSSHEPAALVPTPQEGLDPGLRRRRDAAVREQLSRGQAMNESERAQRLIDEFVTQATARGIAPEPLRARLLDGAEVKTPHRGWYIRTNRSVAIGENGEYYVLTVPGGWRQRWRGVSVAPSPPQLVVGRGGRDGDSGDLSTFLSWRLDQG